MRLPRHSYLHCCHKSFNMKRDVIFPDLRECTWSQTRMLEARFDCMCLYVFKHYVQTFNKAFQVAPEPSSVLRDARVEKTESKCVSFFYTLNWTDSNWTIILLLAYCERYLWFVYDATIKQQIKSTARAFPPFFFLDPRAFCQIC